MVRKNRTVVIDTYALIADLTGQAPPTATRVLDSVRLGETRGVIHYLIVYELAYHWRRKRLPFRNEGELREFIETYFYVASLDPVIALEAAEIKVLGDKLLREAVEYGVRGRKLSTADTTTIALARRLNAPIVTGDRDLAYVAEKIGVKIIW